VDTLEQLQKQLGSLEELQGIVKTMKALSAANIHQYEQAVKSLAGYYRTIEMGLHVVLKDLAPTNLPEQTPQHVAPMAAVVFGSDHGLCGRFNEEIARHTLTQLDTITADPARRKILAVGSRLALSLEQAGQPVENVFQVPGAASLITHTVERILLYIDNWQTQEGCGDIYLFYNQHSKLQGYQPTGLQLLPVGLKHFHTLEKEPWPSHGLPTFSMDRKTLFRRLLDQYLFVLIFRACAESQASEHGGRLAAMQAAERSLEEKLGDVTQEYRRARQSVITAELLDLVSGYEAIGSDKRE